MQVICSSNQLGLKALHILCLATLLLIGSAFDKSTNETLEVSFEDCVTTVSCFSTQSETGNCTVQYGQDPFYQDLGPATNGSLNSSFSLPGLQSSTLYYIQTTFILNSELEPIIQRINYTTGSASRFTTTVISLTAVGLSVYILAIVIFTVNTKLCCIFMEDEDADDDDCIKFKLFNCAKDGNCYYGAIFLYLIFIVCLVATIIPLTLWISGFVFISTGSADPCSDDWQFTRDALFISSFFFSLFSLVLTIIACVLNYFAGFVHGSEQLKYD